MSNKPGKTKWRRASAAKPATTNLGSQITNSVIKAETIVAEHGAQPGQTLLTNAAMNLATNPVTNPAIKVGTRPMPNQVPNKATNPGDESGGKKNVSGPYDKHGDGKG